jgi:pimeloyl-ACP methyl ester carboxylesterase
MPGAGQGAESESAVSGARDVPPARDGAFVRVVTREPDPGVPLPPAGQALAPPPPPPPAVPTLVAGPTTGWINAPWRPARSVPPAAGGSTLARLVGAGLVGAVLLLGGAISAVRIAATYPSWVLPTGAAEVHEAWLWVVVFVVAMTALAVWLGRRYLAQAATRTGGADIARFISSTSGPASDAPSASSAADPGTEPLAIRPMRRTVRAAVLGAIAGALLLAVGQVVLANAAGVASLRAGAAVVAAGVVVLVLGAGLLPVIFRGTDRRLAEASRAADGGHVHDPGPRAVAWSPLAAIGIVASAGLAFGLSGGALEPAVCDVGPGWSCGIVRVPVDRSAPAGELIEMAYTIHGAEAAAPGLPRRVLVLAVGGPGIAGLPEADWMYQQLDARVRDAFDVVVYDPRATGQTDPHDCPDAAGRYYLDDRDLSAALVREFADRCVSEADVAEGDLRRYGSAAVAEDIDALRDVLGVERISLYGVSYGTVVAQAYAAAHPDRLDGLVLDAPLDRSLTPARVWAIAAAGFEEALSHTFTACREDRSCSDDLPSPERTWQRLLEVTADGPLRGEVSTADGDTYTVSLDRRDIADLMQAALYSTTGRMSFLRALAAFDRGDPRGLARLWDAWSGGSGDSSFAYYATWCADARHSPTPRTDDYDAFVDVASREGIRDPGSLGVAYATIPCLFWPFQADRFVPPAEAATVPTLILSATSDPITPIAEARSILGRHPEARLVETRGGAHGSLGERCPTERMTRFLVDGELPDSRTTVCLGVIVDTYLPLAPSPAATADDAVSGLFWELLADPLVIDWAGDEPLDVACTDGGTASFAPVDEAWRSEVTLDDCSYATNAVWNGGGTLDLSRWDADLRLVSPRGDVHLEATSDDWRIDGTWDGRPVAVDR